MCTYLIILVYGNHMLSKVEAYNLEEFLIFARNNYKKINT